MDALVKEYQTALADNSWHDRAVTEASDELLRLFQVKKDHIPEQVLDELRLTLHNLFLNDPENRELPLRTVCINAPEFILNGTLDDSFGNSPANRLEILPETCHYIDDPNIKKLFSDFLIQRMNELQSSLDSLWKHEGSKTRRGTNSRESYNSKKKALKNEEAATIEADVKEKLGKHGICLKTLRLRHSISQLTSLRQARKKNFVSIVRVAAQSILARQAEKNGRERTVKVFERGRRFNSFVGYVQRGGLLRAINNTTSDVTNIEKK